MEKTKGFWRALLKEKIGVVKPEDAWSLRMDESLELYQVPPGWKRFLQDHAYARYSLNRSLTEFILLFHVLWEPHKRQGRIQMRCFQQQCHECFSKHEEPEFTVESASKVLDRLIVTIRKECYGEHIEDADISEVVIHSTGPHRRELCEACQLGLHKGSQDGPRAYND
ncbi:receptor-transporting protein 2-like [Anolis sagrei]|uniref:receptor-transporting protein 2-like n=1 Tax=Anolis sagrei TaxID=38937 RepID=UPI0035227BF9